MQLAEVSGVVQVVQMLALSTEIFVHNAYSAKTARGGRVRAAEQKKKVASATYFSSWFSLSWWASYHFLQASSQQVKFSSSLQLKQQSSLSAQFLHVMVFTSLSFLSVIIITWFHGFVKYFLERNRDFLHLDFFQKLRVIENFLGRNHQIKIIKEHYVFPFPLS